MLGGKLPSSENSHALLFLCVGGCLGKLVKAPVQQRVSGSIYCSVVFATQAKFTVLFWGDIDVTAVDDFVTKGGCIEQKTFF